MKFYKKLIKTCFVDQKKFLNYINLLTKTKMVMYYFNLDFSQRYKRIVESLKLLK